MANQVFKDVTGELLEVGKSTVKASGKAAQDIAKQAVKTVMNRQDSGEDEFVKNLYGKTGGSDKKIEEMVEDGGDKKPELNKMSKLDAVKSQERYKQIQEEIRIETRKRKEQPKKYTTGQTGFDEERIEDPETYFDKQEKKQEEIKDKQKKQSLKANKGTGETKVGI